MLLNLSFLIAQPTGLMVYAHNLLPHLQPLHPTVLAAQTIGGFDCLEIPPTLTADRGTKGHLARLLWTQQRLPKIYRDCHENLLFSPIPEAPLWSSCRHVVTVHDLIPLRFPKRFSPLMPYFRYYIPQVLAQAEHIICNSAATARDVSELLGIPDAKLTPIPLAYDDRHFRDLDLPPEPYFLYIGRSDPHKNLRRVIAAFAQLRNRDDYELRIVGSTDARYTPKLQAEAAALGIADRVQFLNYVPYAELPALINQAIALVFPSLWEGFGLPVLEAMACGTPVITSTVASLPEVAGGAALLVNPTLTTEIADAMRLVAQDADLRSRLRQAGLDRARQFSWTKTGQATVKVLERYL